MNLREIEERVAAIDAQPGVEYLSDLLLAYGLPRTSISRLMSGTYDKAETPHERLWKDKVYFRWADEPDEALYELIEAARTDERVLRHQPRFLIVKNDCRLLARDEKTGATLDIKVRELAANATFFAPWAGFEKTQLENLNYADRKAAEKMAKLYDEVIRHNEIETEEVIHDLNVFFSRLLFCFFAEDTGVFEPGSFTNALGSFTRGTGEDTNAFLDALFEVLDTDPTVRDGIPEHLRRFGYVNGNLFERRSPAPRFSAKARAVILECGTLDWSQINPDIFGSMIQAVVHPGQRAGLGMHYTSVENIMKVIRPLFLDELEEAFAMAGTAKKLDALLARIAAIRVFDPACGSGNFLVIAYKELRRLEHRILRRITEVEPHRAALFSDSCIRLGNFCGIEIDDFAHEIAILSLWLAKHQINVEFKELFGTDIPLIPLREAGNVVCANAARIEWTDVCDPTGETYVLGNPPYAGSSTQSADQKDDFAEYFGSSRYPASLDYVALWFLKGANFVASAPQTDAAFVATNSVTQGDHVAVMWPYLLAAGVQISFAHESFRWSNQARRNAGVTCVVVGLTAKDRSPKNLLYSDGARRVVDGLTPYLTEGRPDLIVRPRRTPQPGFPPMLWGSKPTDGGFLTMSRQERDALLEGDPSASRFIKRYMGAEELLGGKERYCLWIKDDEAGVAAALAGIKQRLDRVAAFRAQSKKPATARLAASPYRFGEVRFRSTPAVIVPIHSSERRVYIPIDFVGPDTVISNAANAIYDAEPWLFALLQSRMHMSWARAVGGRIKTDIRYSAVLVYNTFPAPVISGSQRTALTEAAVAVLSAREQFPDQTLAQLYDPDKMPGVLRTAHRAVDELVDGLYTAKPVESDAARLELLFEMYEAMTREEPAAARA